MNKATKKIQPAKEDRRVQRTQQLLQEALRALILEKGYDAVTIQDVIDRANVGRATFYAHFQDKEHLLLSGFVALWNQFEAFFASDSFAAENPWQISLALFQHAENHREIYKAMAGKKGAAIVLTHLQQRLSKILQSHLEPQLTKRKKAFPADVLTQYLVSSLTTLLTWWMDSNSSYTAEQMQAFYQRLVQPGVESILL